MQCCFVSMLSSKHCISCRLTQDVHGLMKSCAGAQHASQHTIPVGCLSCSVHASLWQPSALLAKFRPWYPSQSLSLSFRDWEGLDYYAALIG